MSPLVLLIFIFGFFLSFWLPGEYTGKTCVSGPNSGFMYKRDPELGPLTHVFSRYMQGHFATHANGKRRTRKKDASH